MSERPCKVLILDHDPDVLILLQHVLENAGLDTTITWDAAEARELTLKTTFDVILIGDHPPELCAKTILHSHKPFPHACLLLGAHESRAESLRQIGISAIVPKRDAHSVLQIVHEHLRSIRAKSASAA